jgi:hypothetical protein
LRPELLHRVIDAVGLEDCGELIAQATPAQLSHIFDLDLWRAERPGVDEQFDVDRFGLWLEVLADAGVDIAAAKLAALPPGQLVPGLAHHLRVFDLGAVVDFETTDGDRWDYSGPVRGRTGIEVGGYHIVSRREEAWDAIAAVLVALEADHADRFHLLMGGVRSLSHAAREEDGFHTLLEDRDQMMFEAAAARGERRQARGFASAADARAFLQMSRTVTPESIQPNPLATDYARSIEMRPPDDDAVPEPPAEDLQEVAALLADAGVTTLQDPRGLLPSGEPQAESLLHGLMQHVFDRDPVAYGERNFELAYLANVLIAGCPVQGRPFTATEAADAAMAICNLGLERIAAPTGHLVHNDLIGPFQVGWSLLHERVSMFAARALADLLAGVRVDDSELQGTLNLLGVRLRRAAQAGTPWRAAPALEVITSIDLPAWAALVGLIAECPVIHAGLTASVTRSARAVDPNAFEFIAHVDQLDLVRQFMEMLPGRLR